MKLSVQADFNEAKLKDYMTRAVRIWTDGIDTYYASISASEGSDKATGSVGLRLRGGKTTTVALSHELMVQAVAMGAAAEGNPVDPDSVRFQYNPSRGFGGGSSVSAKAQSTSAAPAAATEQQGFPLPVTVRFEEKEVVEILSSAVAKSTGKKVNSARISYYESGTLGTATVQMTATGTGEVKLSADELKETLAEELNSRGYVTTAEGISFSHTPGAGFGGPPRTSAVVQLTRMPK